jgi:alkyl sulfatase BDS1-like metallo-beta-lactamase superfamily hydrolase
MGTAHQNMGRESGGIARILLFVLAILVIGGVWLYLDEDAGAGLKKDAKLKTLEMIGEMAVSKLSSVPGDSEGTHGSAVDMIKLPIEVRKVTDNVYYATGVANTVMVTTSEGNVIFDTGLIIQAAKQLRLLKEQVSDGPVSNVILSHSHADHVGGTALWLDEGTKIVAHQQFEEELRYLQQLKPYLYGRNRTLFPWMPEDPANIGMLEYGSIKPDITVDDDDVYSFTLGGVEFQVIGAPGAEGADNIVLWLPQQKILISGDFFGPQFPQFPNIFTMRGEKVRKPMEYVASLDKLIALAPEIVIPSHLNPTVGAAEIHANMVRIRDAVKYVHDETVAGMNAGKDVHQLMKEIKLPANLDLVQNHGRVDWAVKSIWEYYATWFHYDSTTELYPVPAKDVYADLAAAAGPEALHSLAKNYLHKDEPVKALHIVEVTLKGYPQDRTALTLRQQALQRLMEKAEAGTRNDYEIYWLKSRLADTQERLESAH